MDILSIFPYDTFDELTINIGDISCGWMDITLATKKRQFDYSASYVGGGDPINYLLESTVLLLTKEPVIVYGDTYWTRERIIETKVRKYEVVIHDTEGQYIEWILRFSDDVLTVVIFQDIFTELLDDLIYYDFNRDEYEKREFEKLPDLTKNLLFAFKGPPLLFAQKLIDACHELDLKCVNKENKTEWGYNYSESNLKKLKDWISDSSN